MKCQMCGTETYRSRGGADICPNCGYGSANWQPPAPVTSPASEPPDPQLVLATTRFSLRLFQAIANQHRASNLLVSPLSVAIALSMALNGAANPTQADMLATLELESWSVERVNVAIANLLKTLASIDPQVQLAIANSIWVNHQLVLSPSFLDRCQTFYQAIARKLDFSQPNAATTINHWVNTQTQGKISQIVNSLSTRDALLLLNAIYFKGIWRHPFDPQHTQPQPFTHLDGHQTSVAMMRQSGRFNYYESDRMQAVSLPYSEGRLRMVLLLPLAEVPWAGFLTDLTLERWESLLLQLRQRKGTVRLPQFKLQSTIELNSVLTDLGMGSAFDSRANFSLLFSSPEAPALQISQVLHKGVIEVNEAGTEAAAVTAVRMTKALVEPPFELVFDRPFVAVIQDSQTGAILFISAVVEPG